MTAPPAAAAYTPSLMDARINISAPPAITITAPPPAITQPKDYMQYRSQITQHSKPYEFPQQDNFSKDLLKEPSLSNLQSQFNNSNVYNAV